MFRAIIWSSSGGQIIYIYSIWYRHSL